MNKISIVGAGRVGETAASILAQQNLCSEVVLLDVRDGAAAGAALDIQQSAAYFGFDTRVSGSNDPEIISNSELVIITAGSPRKPGMSRSDVLDVNRKVIDSIVDEVQKFAPDTLLLLVSNPVDVLTWHALQRTGWNRNRIIGQAGVLDSSRMAGFISMETGYSIKDIHTMVIGGHGDIMVPLFRHTGINGIPATEFLDAAAMQRITERTCHGGAEVLELRKTSSAYNAPAAAIATMVDAICNNRRRILPCISALEGEYGEHNVTAGVPVILGRNGIESVVEVELDESEQAAFRRSIAKIRKNLALL
ncbi:MAG: malate dehydrogenase [Thiohalobacterales bacterium]